MFRLTVKTSITLSKIFMAMATTSSDTALFLAGGAAERASFKMVNSFLMNFSTTLDENLRQESWQSSPESLS